MKLVVGLGNPGQKYKGTRHNIGFQVLTCLAQRHNAGRSKSKFNAEVVETIIQNEKTVLLSPLTYMNLSGQSVKAAVDFYKLELAELLVICDDLSLDIARLRARPGGSAGGQKGLKDIIQRLGSQEFSRLRIGIGKPPANWEAADYVLGRFSEEEQSEIANAVVRAADAVETWINEGVQATMNKFNAKPDLENNVEKPCSNTPADSPNENNTATNSNTSQNFEPSENNKTKS